MFDLGNAKNNQLALKNKSNKYYNELITIDINDKNDSHAILANQVKSNSVCLDVGCSVGYIGELLKKEKHCKVYGIEIDEEAIKMAEKKLCYEQIYNFSVTNKQNDEYKSFFKSHLKFDYIIFADILEHLINPAAVLYEFSKKLKRNGCILVSIPNIAHMDISKNLINRKFNYNTTGLLDNTHIRFFTKTSFIEMIQNLNLTYKTNLHVKNIFKTTVVPPYASQYPNLYKLLNDDNELCTLQYIYEIENSSKNKNLVFHEKNYYDQIEKQISERNAFLEKIHVQENEIHNFELKSDNYEIQLNSCQAQIKNLENQLEQLTNDLKDNILKLEQTKQDLEKAQLESNLLRQELYKILTSTSWKITKPLRDIRNMLTKKK